MQFSYKNNMKPSLLLLVGKSVLLSDIRLLCIYLLCVCEMFVMAEGYETRLSILIQHLIITLMAPPAPVLAVSKASSVCSNWNL